MPTFEIPVVGAIEFANNKDGYWEFELPMRGGDVPVDINAEGEAFTKAMLEEIRPFIADATRFDEIARDVFRLDFSEKPEGTVGIYLSHHAEELSEKELLKIFGVEDPDDLTIDHLLDALQLKRIGLYPGDESFAAVFDYTIDEEATDYLLSVTFDKDGEVAGLSMES